MTSGNAEEIIKRVPDDVEILFVPDRHLGQFLIEVTGRPMILWDGSCMVHEVFSVGDLLRLKRRMPGIDHDRAPGVPDEHPRAERVRGGTEAMIKFVAGYRGADRLPGRHAKPTCSGSWRRRFHAIGITRCPV